MADDLDVATRCARTVALWHPTAIRRAPIGMYSLRGPAPAAASIGSDRTRRLRCVGSNGWRRLDGGAVVVPLRGGIRAAADISSGRLDRVSARFVGVQEPAVAGLAGRTLEPRRAAAQQTAGLHNAACNVNPIP